MLKKSVVTTITLSMISTDLLAFQSSLETIYDSGNTLNASVYINDNAGPGRSEIPPKKQAFNPLDFGFPVKSIKWRAGYFDPIKINASTLPRTLFVIGCNQHSIDWLENRKEALIKMEAVGFVIQCDDRQSLDHLKTMAQPLFVTPMEANAIGDKVNHYIYPAVITTSSIEQ